MTQKKYLFFFFFISNEITGPETPLSFCFIVFFFQKNHIAFCWFKLRVKQRIYYKQMKSSSFRKKKNKNAKMCPVENFVMLLQKPGENNAQQRSTSSLYRFVFLLFCFVFFLRIRAFFCVSLLLSFCVCVCMYFKQKHTENG